MNARNHYTPEPTNHGYWAVREVRTGRLTRLGWDDQPMNEQQAREMARYLNGNQPQQATEAT